MCENDIEDKLDFSSVIVQRQQRRISNPFWSLFLNALSYFMFTVLVIIFFPFRKMVGVYLKYKNKNIYGGLVANEDMPFFVHEKSKWCIAVVTYFLSEREINMMDKVKKNLQEKIFDHPDHYPKLTSTVHQFWGYFYRKKHQCNINDAAKAINIKNDQELTDKYLKAYTAEVIADEFGKNGSMLWDVHVAPHPIKCKSNDSFIYPIVSRFHHSIADGTSLVSLFIQLYGDKSSENYNKEVFQKLMNAEKKEKRSKSLLDLTINNLTHFSKTVLLYLEVQFISFGRLIGTNQLRPNDINALHGTNYTGKKICAWASEDKIECIPLVKNIKNREKTKFSCVVSTAIAASLSHYFKRVVAFVTKNMLYMPIQVLKLLFGWTSQTYLLSNIPGSTTIKARDGCVIEKMIPIAPITRGIGISLALLSYDEKFQIGVSIEKSLVDSQKEAQKIVDDIFFYIKLLDMQSQKKIF